MESRKQVGTRRSKAPSDDNSLGIHEICRAVLFGTFVMALSALALLLIGAGIAYSNKDPASIAKPLAFTSLYISMLVGGFAAAKRSGENKLLCGAIYTALAFLLLFILKLILAGKGGEINGSTYYLLGVPFSAAAGVLLSSLSREKKTMSKKKRAEMFSRKK